MTTANDLRTTISIAGMKPSDVASITGVSVRQVQNWLSGKTPVPFLAMNAILAEARARNETIELITSEKKDRIAALERNLIEERESLNKKTNKTSKKTEGDK